jgi:hypothetical protein
MSHPPGLHLRSRGRSSYYEVLQTSSRIPIPTTGLILSTTFAFLFRFADSFEYGYTLSYSGPYACQSCLSLLSICVPSSVERLCANCFCGCVLLEEVHRIVRVESGSVLVLIGGSAFVNCSSLSSICVPSSVPMLRRCLFGSCRSIWTVTFEFRSRLSRIESHAFRPRLKHSANIVFPTAPTPAFDGRMRIWFQAVAY